MFAVTGKRTTIVQELEKLTGEEAARIDYGQLVAGEALGLNRDCTRVVLAAGVLWGKELGDMTDAQALECAHVNLVMPLRICEYFLKREPLIRICIVGSYSANAGSFDRIYAATKGGVAQYVHTRTLAPGQILCAVAPTIIIDSGMTRRRPDFQGLEERRNTVRALDVAAVIRVLLWETEPETFRRRERVVPITKRHPI